MLMTILHLQYYIWQYYIGSIIFVVLVYVKIPDNVYTFLLLNILTNCYFLHLHVCVCVYV